MTTETPEQRAAAVSARMTPEERRRRIRDIEHGNHLAGRHTTKVDGCRDCFPVSGSPGPTDDEVMRVTRGEINRLTREATHAALAAVRELRDTAQALIDYGPSNRANAKYARKVALHDALSDALERLDDLDPKEEK